MPRARIRWIVTMSVLAACVRTGLRSETRVSERKALARLGDKKQGLCTPRAIWAGPADVDEPAMEAVMVGQNGNEPVQ